MNTKTQCQVGNSTDMHYNRYHIKTQLSVLSFGHANQLQSVQFCSTVLTNHFQQFRVGSCKNGCGCEGARSSIQNAEGEESKCLSVLHRKRFWFSGLMDRSDVYNALKKVCRRGDKQ